VRRTGIGLEQKTTTLVLKDHRGLRVALFSGRGWIVVYEGRRHEVLELRISRNRFWRCACVNQVGRLLACRCRLTENHENKNATGKCKRRPSLDWRVD